MVEVQSSLGDTLYFPLIFNDFNVPSYHPLLDCAMNIYTDDDAKEITKNLIAGLRTNFKNNNFKVSQPTMEWSLQVLGYALRFIDGNFEQENSIFHQAVLIYKDWIKSFCEKKNTTDENDKFVEIFIYHLSQAFSSNPLRFATEEIELDLYQYVFIFRKAENHHLNDLLLHFFFGGALEVNALISMTSKPEVLQDHFKNLYDFGLQSLLFESLPQKTFDSISNKITKLMKVPDFVNSFVGYFANIYSWNRSQVQLQFYFEKIDSHSIDVKYQAFSAIVSEWMNRIKSNEKSITLTEIPTNEIKAKYYPWFNCEAAMKNREPLFQLLKYGEPEETPDLVIAAKQIIKDSFNLPKDDKRYFETIVVAGSFLLSQIDFTLSIADSILKFLEDLASVTDKNVMSVSWLFVILSVLIESGSLSAEQLKIIETRMPAMFSINFGKCDQASDYSSILMGCLVISILLENSQMYSYFLQLLKECTPSKDKELQNNPLTKVNLELYAAFVPLVMPNCGFANEIKLTKENICSLLEKRSSITFKQMLIAMITLSFGTDHFLKHGDDATAILNQIGDGSTDDDDKSAVFQPKDYVAAFRNAILCGHDYIINYHETDTEELTEHYVTKDYIISIVGAHKLVIRHGFGTTVYHVEDRGGRSLMVKEEPLPEVEEDVKEEEEDDIWSELGKDDADDELLKEIVKMDQMFSDHTRFKKYEQPPDKKCKSDAYALLVDLGLFNYDTQKTVKRLAPKYIRDIIELDETLSTGHLDVGLLQLGSTEDEEFISRPTPGLEKLREELNSVNSVLSSQLVKFEYTAPCLTSNETHKTSASAVRMMGFLVVLNETTRVISKDSAHINSFKLVMELKPHGDVYEVTLFKSPPSCLLPFICNNASRWVISRKRIGQFVALCVLLNQTNEPEKKDNILRGPDTFITNFYNRQQRIRGLFSNPNKCMSQLQLSEFAK